MIKMLVSQLVRVCDLSILYSSNRIVSKIIPTAQSQTITKFSIIISTKLTINFMMEYIFVYIFSFRISELHCNFSQPPLMLIHNWIKIATNNWFYSQAKTDMRSYAQSGRQHAIRATTVTHTQATLTMFNPIHNLKTHFFFNRNRKIKPFYIFFLSNYTMKNKTKKKKYPAQQQLPIFKTYKFISFIARGFYFISHLDRRDVFLFILF